MAIISQTSSFLLDNPVMLLAGLPIFLSIYAGTKFMMKRGANPFKEDLRRPPKPLETDQTKRDAILKQGFLPKKVPEDLDVIVIGSGIGGLTAANILSRAGKKVLVLEQHDRAGGCCHTFTEKGYEFDVGIHYICGVTEKGTIKNMVDQLAEGQLQWADMDPEYDVVTLGTGAEKRVYPHKTGGVKVWRDQMVSLFPKEEKQIDKYLSLVEQNEFATTGGVLLKVLPLPIAKLLVKSGLVSSINRYLQIAGTKTETMLDSLNISDDLEAVLSSAWGDYGVPPSRSSAYLALSVSKGYMETSNYPVGGASEMIIHLIPQIERNGGRVLVRAPVSKILTDGSGKVTGVRVHRSSGDVDISAPLVISNAGVLNTLTYLLPPEVAQKSPMYSLLNQKVLRPSIACLQVFVGLKGTAKELGLKPQNIWAYSSPKFSEDLEEYMNLDADEAAEHTPPLTFISMNGAKDPTFLERFPDKSSIVVVAACNAEWFKEWENERVMKRGADYDHLKERFGQTLWNVVLSNYPQLEDKVDYFEVGTSLTNDYYLGTRHGEMYALDHDVQRFGNPDIAMNLRPNTGIPGLYLAGQDMFCVGYVGALVGGVLATVDILKRNVFDDVDNLTNKLKKME